MGRATSRGVVLALDTLAYEKACDVILKDPAVQDAIDVLLDRMCAAFRKRLAGRRR